MLWKRIGVAGFALLVLTVSVGADGFRNPPDGAAGMGRAGARYVYGDDASVMSYNPANLMDLENASILNGANIAASKAKFTAPTGVSEDSDDTPAVLPYVYAAWPVEEGKYVVGIGLNVPYGQSRSWEKDGLFRFIAPHYAQMKTLNASPSVATRLTDNLTAGVGLDIMWSQLTFDQSLPWMPLPMGFAGPSSVMQFEGDGIALGAHVGITLAVTEKQRLAVSYRAPMTVEYDGDFTIFDPPPPVALPPGVTPVSDAEAEMEFPAVVAVAYGIQAGDALRLEATVEWVEHSRNSDIKLDLGNNNILALAARGATDLPQKWDDAWTVGVGADWQVDEEWTARAGWFYLPTPVPPSTLTPTLPEGDEHVLSVGLGFRRGEHAADVGVAYTVTEDIVVSDVANPIQGEYEFSKLLVAVSYGYQF